MSKTQAPNPLNGDKVAADKNKNADITQDDLTLQDERDALRKARDNESSDHAAGERFDEHGNLHFGDQAQPDRKNFTNESDGVEYSAGSDIAPTSTGAENDRGSGNTGRTPTNSASSGDTSNSDEGTSGKETHTSSYVPSDTSNSDPIATKSIKAEATLNVAEQNDANDGEDEVANEPDRTPANEAPTDIGLSNDTVQENQAGVTVATLSASDPDSNETFTFTIQNDPSGLFEVVGNELKLKDGISLDHEAQEVYEIVFQVEDSAGNVHSQTFSINVADVNEGPTDLQLNGNTVNENDAGATVGTLSIVDPDAGDSVTYTVSDDRFEVVGNELKLKDGVSLDHETIDALDITVTATDTGGLTTSETFSVNVADTNEGPTDLQLNGNTINENDTGATVGTLSIVDPDAGDSVTYAVSDDRFEVVGNELKLKDGVSLDHETIDALDITVTATDTGGLATTETFSVNIADVNEGPTNISLSGNTVDENNAGAVVAALSSTDVDDGDTAAYAIDDDPSGLFEVVGNELKLKDGVSLDHEGQDAYDISLKVTDSAGATYTETVTINVADVNETPTDILLSNNNVDENDAGATVGVLSSIDPDEGDTATFVVSDDRFEVVGNELKLKDGVELNYENEQSIDVTVTATDTHGASTTELFEIDVNNVNEGPSLGLASSQGLQASYYNVGSSLSSLDQVDFNAAPDATEIVDSIDHMQHYEPFWEGGPDSHFAAKYEGQLVVEEGGSYTFHMASDDGSMLFIDGQPVLDNDGLHGTQTRTVTLELEEGSHDIEVRYFENGGAQTLQLAWNGPDTDGQTQVIGGESFENGFYADTLTVAEDENGAAVAELTVTDPDAGESHSFEVSDDRFEVAEEDGAFVLKLKEGESLDYETESSVDVSVTVTDSAGASDTAQYSIAVENTNDAPDIDVVGGEGLQASYYNVGHSITNLGQIDFDATPDATAVVGAIDHMQGYESFWDGAPGDYFAAKYEGQVVVEEGGSYTFHLASDDGSMLFIDGQPVLDNDGLHGTRTRTVTLELDEGSHDIEVRYFENGGAQTLQLAWTGPDTDGEQQVISGDSFRLPGVTDEDYLGISENTEGDVAAILSITDVNGDAVTYAVDDSRFELVETEEGVALKLKDGVSVDHETESEISVTVTATDEHGESSTSDISIPVADVNEKPTDIDLSDFSINENEAGAVVATLTATDPDTNDTSSFSITQDDSNLFEVVGNELKLKDGVSLDHEGQDAYDITLEVEDSAGNTHSETVTINVADLNEGPTDINVTSVLEVESAEAPGAEAGVHVIGIYREGSDVNILDGAPDLVTSSTHNYFEHSSLGHTGYNYMGGNKWFADNGIDISGLQGGKIVFSDGTVGEIDAASNGAGSRESAYIYYNAVDEDTVATVAETADEGTVVAHLSTVDPDADDSHVYTIEDDPSGNFEIVNDNGDWQVRVKPGAEIDFETQDSHDITLQVTDSAGNTHSESVTISVQDANEAPLDIEFSPDLSNHDNLVDGAEAGVQVVGLYRAGSDVNLLDGAPDLTTISSHNYFDHSNLGHTGYNYMGGNKWFADNDIDISGMRGGKIVFADGTVGEIDTAYNGVGSHESAYVYYRAYDPDAEMTITENEEGAVVSELSTIDPDNGDSHTYSVSDDRFEVVTEGNNTVLKLKDGVSLDHEEQSALDITVQVEDSAGNTYSETVTVNVADVNESPTDISASGNSVDENQAGAVVASLEATDVDDGDTATFTLTEDTSGNFEIVGNELKLKEGVSLDHEEQDTYEVTVQVEDSAGNTYQKTITVNVNDANEAPVDLAVTGLSSSEEASITDGAMQISNGGGEASSIVDFSGGDPSSGEIVVNVAYLDNSFDLSVNGESLAEGTIQLEHAHYDPANESFLQFADGTAISQPWVASDDGGPRIKLVITEDGVQAFATRTPSSTTMEPLELVNGEFTPPTFIDGENTVTIVNQNQGGPDGLSLEVTGSFNAEAPLGVSENESGSIIGTVSATDPDEGDTLTFSVSDDRFEVVDNQLKLKDGVSLDYETEQAIEVTVTVTDSDGASVSETITVNVTDIDETNVIEGTNNNDRLTGTDGQDVINAKDGNDVVYGGADNDVIEGGAGNDTILGQAGADQLSGGDGNDLLYVDSDDTHIDGGDGTDRVIVQGEGGVDIDMTASSVERVDGGAGDDRIDASGMTERATQVSNAGDDTLIGGDGNDVQYGGADNDVIEGGAGNDTILGQAGADQLSGGDGNDLLYVDSDDTHIDGGDGTDRVIVQGEGGVDIDMTASSVERVDGGAGDDRIDASGMTERATQVSNAGDDTLIGGDGNDVQYGGADNDVIEGGAGNDTILGQAGADQLSGGDGNDLLYVDSDDTHIDGGDGTDRVIVQGEGGVDIDMTASSVERVDGGAGDDRIDASGMTERATQVSNAGDDTLIGGDGNDVQYGGADNDVIEGGAGNDTILGQAGADQLSGGDGNDLLYVDSDDTHIDGGDGTDRVIVQGEGGVDIDMTASSVERVDGGAGDDRIDASGMTERATQVSNAGDDTLIGGDGNDVQYGGADNDVIEGGAGNDTILGQAGADQLSGGDGNDLLYVDSDDTHIDGGDGTDRVIVQGEGGVDIDMTASSVERVDGGAGDDRIDASGMTERATQVSNAGDDTLIGGDGNDVQYGGADNDVIEGGAGNDTILGQAGADQLSGGDGNDLLYVDSDDTHIDGGDGTDRVIVQGEGGVDIDMTASSVERVDGGAGDDRIDASGMTERATQVSNAGDDTLIGGDGNDVQYGGADNDVIEGGAGNDTILGQAGADQLSGGDGNDLLYVDSDDTHIDGGDGTDRVIVQGEGGVDIDMTASSVERVDGGAGDDRIDASGMTERATQVSNAGDDTLIGGDGNDVQYGGADNDVIEGGAGNDTILGQAGADQLSGGDGNDLLYVDSDDTHIDGGDGTDRVIVQGEGGVDIDMTASSVERVDGGAGDDRIDASGMTERATQVSNAGDDTLIGGDGNDVQYGGADNDVIEGGAGNDTILGQDGNDTMTGGEGNDIMTGGDGDDIFVYNVGDGSDRINGGSGWTDTIQLSDANGSPGEFGVDWTVELSEGSIVSMDEDGITFSDDADGIITFDDGTTITFTDIEQMGI